MDSPRNDSHCSRNYDKNSTDLTHNTPAQLDVGNASKHLAEVYFYGRIGHVFRVPQIGLFEQGLSLEGLLQFALSTYSRIIFSLDSLCPTLPVRMSRKERFIMINATNEQLELGFNRIKLLTSSPQPQGRVARAAWWFAQMREAVERAMDWSNVGEPRPEQIWIPGAAREVKV